MGSPFSLLLISLAWVVCVYACSAIVGRFPGSELHVGLWSHPSLGCLNRLGKTPRILVLLSLLHNIVELIFFFLIIVCLQNGERSRRDFH